MLIIWVLKNIKHDVCNLVKLVLLGIKIFNERGGTNKIVDINTQTVAGKKYYLKS